MAEARGHQRHMPPPPLHSAWSGDSALPSRTMSKLIIITRMYRIWYLKLHKINNIIIHCPSGYKITILLWLNGEIGMVSGHASAPPQHRVSSSTNDLCTYTLTIFIIDLLCISFVYVLVHVFANILLGKLYIHVNIIFQITPWPKVSHTGGPSTNPGPYVIGSSSQLIIVIPHYCTWSWKFLLDNNLTLPSYLGTTENIHWNKVYNYFHPCVRQISP